ncbi:MAG: RusA family crossover junction endodeoxyribonuclease [Planctomycetota bacterium]
MKCLRICVSTPPSKKNNMRSGYRGRPCKGRVVIASEREIEAALIEAMWRKPRPLIASHDVGVEIDHLVGPELVEVRVVDLGAPRCVPGTRRTGRKRDVPNLGEVVCDVMQSWAYENDSQIADYRVRRVV